MTAKPGLKTNTDKMLNAEQKELNLRSMMRDMKTVLVAYSGGVDSSYLAFIANDELETKAVCVTGISPSVAEVQREQAKNIAEDNNLNHYFIDTNELRDKNYQANPTNRCYFCKSELYGKLSQIVSDEGINYLLDGANADDKTDHRPGSVAAIENKVRSPLAELGFTKEEIREQSRKHNLMTWEKPASPCLASRIQYGIPVTIERLSKVERGEEVLRELGFIEFRVRNHDNIVRIEIAPNELIKALDKNVTDEIAEAFRKIGFKYVTLDLHGFRSGAMNEIL